MNQKKRQHVLIAGAGLCMLIVMRQLFGGGDQQNNARAAVLPAGTTMTGVQDEQASTTAVSTIRSGFYRSVRQKLQAFLPEQNDAFFIQPGIADPKSAMGSILNPNSNLLPPLPVASGFEIRNPAFTGQSMSTRGREEEKVRGREDEGVEGAGMSNPSAPPPQSPNPKLKGFVRQAETGMAIALIEWENRLLQVSTEPGSEWQIVSYDEESITVKRGEERWELKRE